METKEAIKFIKDLQGVVKDYGKDKIPAGDAMSWLYNNQDNLKLILKCLQKK